MANKIQIKRGLKAKLPVLSDGEFGLCTDTKEVFVGNSGTNVDVTNKNRISLMESNINKNTTKIDALAFNLKESRVGTESWDITLNRLSGNTIYIPEGTYDLNAMITLKSNTHIIMHKNTTLVRKHSDTMFLTESSAITTGYNGAKNIKIEGGTILHNGVTSFKNLVALFHASDIIFEEVTFKNICGSHCIDVVGSRNVLINKCDFLGYIPDSAGSFREVIQIDTAYYDGLPYWANTSTCYDGTRTQNVKVSYCKFDRSETQPAPHILLGTHTQVVGATRSKDITFVNNRCYGNGVVNTYGHAFRLMQLEDVTIKDNYFENYDTIVEINTRANLYNLNGSTTTNTTTPIGCKNVKIIHNTAKRGVSGKNIFVKRINTLGTLATAQKTSEILIDGNIVLGCDSTSNIIDLNDVDNCLMTGNQLRGGNRGIYVDAGGCYNVRSNNNTCTEFVTCGVDYTGDTFVNGNGEGILMYQDGKNEDFLIYFSNVADMDVTNNATLTIKSNSNNAIMYLLNGIEIQSSGGTSRGIARADRPNEMPILKGDNGIDITRSGRTITVANNYDDKSFAVGSDTNTNFRYLATDRLVGSVKARGRYGITATPNTDGVISIELFHNDVLTSRVDLGADYFRPSANNAKDLGTSSYRWRNLYLVNAPNVSSKRELKDNIKVYDDNQAYESIKTLPVYTYNFKKLDDEGNQIGIEAENMLGCLYDEMPIECLNEEAEGIDLYAYTSYVASALKVAIKEIETLKEEIQNLRGV